MRKLVVIISLLLLLVGCSEDKNTETFDDEETRENGSEITKVEENHYNEQVQSVYGDMGNTSGNIQNGGIAAEYGDFIFFSDTMKLISISKEKIKDGIYLSDIQPDKVLDQGFIYSINVIDGNLYYINGNKIYKQNIDGSEKEQLSIPYHVYSLTVYKDKIIFSGAENTESKADLFIMNMTGENIQKLLNNYDNYYIDQGTLYISIKRAEDDYGLFSLDLESIDLQKEIKLDYITTFRSLDSFQVKDENIFYKDSKDLYKNNLVNTLDLNLTSQIKEYEFAIIDQINLYGDTIFYTEDMMLYSMDNNGNNHQLIIPANVYQYSYAGGHLFYYTFSEGQFYPHIQTNVDLNQSAEKYLSRVPPEVIQLYDEIAESGESISIKEIVNREWELDPTYDFMNQDHIVGVTKLLLYSISNRKEELLNTLVSEPKNVDKYFGESLNHLPDYSAHLGGYYDFIIRVDSDRTVFVERGDIDFTIEYEILDGKYYFVKFYGS